MLGISVYFKDLDCKYLEKAAELGAKYVFTSLHIPEEDYSDLDEKMTIFLECCNRLRLEIVPDISPVTFEKLNIEKNDYDSLKRLGFKALRLDYGFDDFDTIKMLLKDFCLLLNASVVNGEYIEKAKEAGVDFTKIVLTHNFYPRNNTGLGIEYFNEKNKDFHKHGLTIQAFIPGDDLKRFPLYEGLPTLERHRSMHPYVAAVELIEKCGVDDVLIGDSKAKIETLEYISTYMKDKTMTIKAHFEKEYEYFYENEYVCRKDLSESVLRIITPRVPGVKPFNNGYRRKGSITMDNELIGRYSGEVQLLKKDFECDARVNVIGFIHPEFIELLDFIDRDTKIRFVRL